MSVFGQLLGAWGWSGLSACVSFITTVATVRLAGETPFALFMVDLAILSLIAVCVELLPTSYFAIKLQDDPERIGPLVHGYLVLGGACVALVGLVHALGGFQAPSWWMFLYIAFIPLHRLALVSMQASGRTHRMFQFTLGTAGIRRALLVAGLTLTAAAAADVLWCAMAAGHAAAALIWGLTGAPRRSAAGVGVASALALLIADRAAYAPYYLNSALKRVRDTATPILAGALIADTSALAKYFLVMRGADFVLGQLRVVEYFSMNLINRAAFLQNRIGRLAVIVAAGVCASFALSLALVAQVALDGEAVLMAALASLIAIPYVFELVRRADAYAAYQPQRVTWSLAVYVGVIGAGFACLSAFSLLSAASLVLAPLAGQTAASLTYLLGRRTGPGGSDGAAHRGEGLR